MWSIWQIRLQGIVAVVGYFTKQSIVLYCIPLLYKLTERNLYYIQVALSTWYIYKVHVFGYIYCTHKYNTCNKY